MPWDLLAIYLQLPLLALVFARLAGMLMFQPVLASLAVPMQVRALLILTLSLLVMPVIGGHAVVPDTLAGLVVAMGRELLLGGLVGLAGAACFLCLQLGGLLIAQEAGLAFGQMVNPDTDEHTDVLGIFYLQFGIALFLAAGGHRALLGACLASFEALPLLGETDLVPAGVELVLAALMTGLTGALQVAAPAVITLFLLNLAMGMVSRTLPQLNIITLGFSLKAMLGFVIMAIALPTAAHAFIEAVQQVTDGVYLLLQAS
jgi:flagellar biosynthetic protein FliR